VIRIQIPIRPQAAASIKQKTRVSCHSVPVNNWRQIDFLSVDTCRIFTLLLGPGKTGVSSEIKRPGEMSFIRLISQITNSTAIN
jgi:hypothetical protein